MTDPDKMMNPDIQEITIGIREMRKIKIYPLSMADQFKVSDIIAEAFTSLLQERDSENIEFVAGIIKIIKDNLKKILKFVIDKDVSQRDLYEEITNNQMVHLAEIIYDVNYGVLTKKVTDLLMDKDSPLGRLLLGFSAAIPNLESETSTSDPGETEE